MKETKESNKEIEEPINSTNLGSKKENQKDNDYSFFLEISKIDDIYSKEIEKLKNNYSLKPEYNTLSYTLFLIQLTSYIGILKDLYLSKLVYFEKTEKNLSIKVIVNKNLKKIINSINSFFNSNKGENGEYKEDDYTFDLFSMFYFFKYHKNLSKDVNISDVALIRTEVIDRKYNNEEGNYDDEEIRFMYNLIESNPNNRPSFEQIYNNKWLNDKKQFLEENNILDEEKSIIELDKRLQLRKMKKKNEKSQKYKFKKKELKSD